MMIYNCLLQQVSHFEFGFWFEFDLEPSWCHNHLVNGGRINICIDIKQILQVMHKVDIFPLLQKHFQ